jgi:signal transduction histidine kinase
LNPQTLQLIAEPWRWRSARAPWSNWVGAALVYIVLTALLMAMSLRFRESPGLPVPLYAAFGLVFIALLLSDYARWPVYVAAHVLAGAGGTAIFTDGAFHGAAVYASIGGLSAAIAAAATRRLLEGTFAIKLQQVLWLLVALAVGVLIGAMLAAVAKLLGVPDPGLGFQHEFWRNVRIWWAGSFLGGVTIAPVLLVWLVRLRDKHAELALRSRVELQVLAVILPLLVVGIFERAARGESLVPLPLLVSPVLVYAAYRLPPRWAVTLATLTVLAVAEMASRRVAPFSVPDPYARIGMTQVAMGIFAVVTFMLSIGTAEGRIIVGRLRDSEQRYRNFVQLSDEAMWRIEIDPPMPVALAIPRQIEWLRQHARVAESSLSFHRIDQTPDTAVMAWRQDVPWSTVYEEHLEQAARGGYSIAGLRFTAPVEGKAHSFLTSFSGVVEAGCLRRIWGVARDVTELADLNARLLREQGRLKSYARQIVTAEEKARRATSVDLHDGIGQSLVSMAMILEVARQQSPPQVRMLIEEVRGRLNEVQEHTRRMISDLSPPGLYDLGLGPALQWLCVYLRTREDLRVMLECDVEEGAVKLDMRILVFKLVRELLRNVVKHAGVQTAQVQVLGNNIELIVRVSDQGKGFEWQMDMFGARGGGFGLWSIADRVSEVGGALNVDTRVGEGSRFEMVFPLQTGVTTITTGLFAAASAEKTA